MSSTAVNSLIQNLANKPLVNRAQHFSGPSGASIHHFHSSHGSKSSGKHSIALTALTLLSFLFFLNILQNCLQEHMDSMATASANTQAQIIIMQSRNKEVRETEAQKRKGEVQEYSNSSFGKETRNNPETLKTQMQDYHHLTQIPVKLRTYEKAVKP